MDNSPHPATAYDGAGFLRQSSHPCGSCGQEGIDLSVATLGLVLLMPVMLIVGMLIALDSPGPILFRQLRMGRGAAVLYRKFRSMVERRCRPFGRAGVSSTNPLAVDRPR